MKASSPNAGEIASAADALKQLKLEAESLCKKKEALDPTAQFNRKVFDELLLRKMSIIPSFEIHRGVKALFDLGSPACELKASMVDV
ncbi:hypothetical protein ACHAXR_001361 [Thalassiosira sp. AJA248-18]